MAATSVVAPGRAPAADEPVIIVGGGLAGLSATVEALRGGAKVILVDKEKFIGGNSAKASSGINGCNTPTQRNLNIEDSTDKLYADTMSAGDRENDPGLVDILVHESAAAVEFLTDLGVDLTDINLCGGHSVPRTHWIPSPKEGKPLPVGVAIIKALREYLEKFQKENPDKIEIRTGVTIIGLVTWNDFITGVRFENKEKKVEELPGKAVILTTGGFSADRTNETSLLEEFAKDKLDLPTTNGAFATGDGVKMARAMGAAVLGMDDVQVHPTAFIDPKDPTATTKFLAAEALRGKGAILVNQKGERFGNELGRRDYLTERINKYCDKNPKANNWHTAYMVMNDESADAFGRPAFNFYSNIKGFFTKVDNAEKLAEHIGSDAQTLAKTLTDYNQFVADYAAGKKPKDRFEKAVFPVAFPLDKPFYVATITPAVHYTMGGLRIDRQTFVYSEFMEKSFKGLLAAGEVTGGVHGRNRLAGNSLLECVVFGRIAGRQAAKISYNKDEL
ncbi:Protein F48E8.3 [Aphelenchoides avenae]|nr:Protein F48E8.3 [Aphelenchus avenae]